MLEVTKSLIEVPFLAKLIFQESKTISTYSLSDFK